jgi:hypothetical protein
MRKRMIKKFLTNSQKFLIVDAPKFIVLRVSIPSKNNGVIFWGHLGLGDAISQACIIEKLLLDNRVVVVPSKTRNYDFLKSTYGTWDGVILEKVNDNPRWENLEILKLKLKHRFRVKVVGHHLLESNWAEQEISLNEQFNRIAGIPPKKLKSTKLRETCEIYSQAHPPKQKYIFVDHYPGTDREIPSKILEDATNSGFEILMNDTSIPLYRLIKILDNALEIHVVASAPLCLALTTDSKCEKKYYYRTKGQGPVSSAAYPDWIDIDLR